MLKTIWRFLTHLVRAARALARDTRLPRAIRLMLILAVIPIPGPFDECIALIALGICAVFYRTILRAAWTTTERSYTCA